MEDVVDECVVNPHESPFWPLLRQQRSRALGAASFSLLATLCSRRPLLAARHVHRAAPAVIAWLLRADANAAHGELWQCLLLLLRCAGESRVWKHVDAKKCVDAVCAHLKQAGFDAPQVLFAALLPVLRALPSSVLKGDTKLASRILSSMWRGTDSEYWHGAIVEPYLLSAYAEVLPFLARRVAAAPAEQALFMAQSLSHVCRDSLSLESLPQKSLWRQRSQCIGQLLRTAPRPTATKLFDNFLPKKIFDTANSLSLPRLAQLLLDAKHVSGAKQFLSIILDRLKTNAQKQNDNLIDELKAAALVISLIENDDNDDDEEISTDQLVDRLLECVIELLTQDDVLDSDVGAAARTLTLETLKCIPDRTLLAQRWTNAVALSLQHSPHAALEFIDATAPLNLRVVVPSLDQYIHDKFENKSVDTIKTLNKNEQNLLILSINNGNNNII